MDDKGYQTEGIDADGHGPALLGFVLFVQPMAMISQSHVVAQFGCHDVDGDGRPFRLYLRGVKFHRRRLYRTDGRRVVQLWLERFVAQPLLKVAFRRVWHVHAFPVLYVLRPDHHGQGKE